MKFSLINDKEYWSTTHDLIQCITTGSEWFGGDPHAIVSELTLINNGDTETPYYLLIKTKYTYAMYI